MVNVRQLAFLFLIMASLGSCLSSTKSKLSPEEQAEFISKGKKITMISFKALSKEVMNAISEGGTEHAAGYCHLKAGSLIDSLENANRVRISRLSDNYRNPLNKPGEPDLMVINAYREQLEKGDELQPHLEMTGKEIVFYSPILILNPVCLNCHGETGSTLTRETEDYIKSLYPRDMATGYKLGDLRGIWKITFLDTESP